MKHAFLTLATVLSLAGPASAQSTPAPSDSDAERGFSMLEEGAQLLFRGLIDQMKPDLDEMRKGLGEATTELGPKLRQFLALVDDLRNYEAPARLPNGDIVMKRRPDAPPPPPLMGTPPAPDYKLNGVSFTSVYLLNTFD